MCFWVLVVVVCREVMMFLEKGDNLRDEERKNPCQQIPIAIFNEHLTTVLLKKKLKN